MKLLINVWGGVPTAVQANLTSRQTGWSTSDVSDVTLAHTNREEEFKHVTTYDGGCVFHLLRRRGVRTVLLGPSGLPRVPLSDHDVPPLDPRNGLSDSCGVDVCSIYEPHEGEADSHDSQTTEDAIRLLRQEAGHDVVVCVNLCGCMDVRVPAAVAFPCRLTHDRRKIPADSTHLPFAEHPLPAEACEALLEYSLLTTERLHTHVARLVEEGAELGYEVALTSTHAFAIGEHGVHGGDVPFGTCGTSFWCTNQRSEFRRRSAHGLWMEFLGIDSHPTLTPAITRGTWRRRAFVRVLCHHRERNFCCVFLETEGRRLQLLLVFDVDSDPSETEDVLSEVAHLHAELIQTTREALRSLKCDFTVSTVSRDDDAVAKEPNLPPPPALRAPTPPPSTSRAPTYRVSFLKPRSRTTPGGETHPVSAEDDAVQEVVAPERESGSADSLAPDPAPPKPPAPPTPPTPPKPSRVSMVSKTPALSSVSAMPTAKAGAAAAPPSLASSLSSPLAASARPYSTLDKQVVGGASKSQTTLSNIRQKESRLNKMHR